MAKKEDLTDAQIEQEEIKAPDDAGVVVDLDPKKEEAKVEEKIDWQEFKKVQARIEFQNRQVDKKLKRLEELAERMSQPTVQPTNEPLDELDQVAQKDWKQAVKIIGKDAAKEFYDEIQAKRQVQENESKQFEELEGSKKRAADRHPELLDEASPKSRVYMQILTEDPSLLKNVRGPEIAMYRMEERLGKPQVRIQPDLRNTRIGATNINGGMRPSLENKFVLTQEQKEFCDNHGIPYEKYAKNVKTLETGGSVEV